MTPMPKSTYLANAVVNHLLGGPEFPRPQALYAALYTAAPTIAGGGTEVSGGGYSRASVDVSSTTWPAAAAGSKSNAQRIGFPAATGSWGSVVAVGLLDAASGGNLLWFGLLPAPVTVNTNDQPGFDPGELTISEA